MAHSDGSNVEATYQRWRQVRDASSITYCHICEMLHYCCRFISGSLWCVWPWYTNEPCPNPHHREYVDEQ